MPSFPSPLPFVEHLVRACAKPINQPAFLEGYAACLQGVGQHGSFVLHGLTIDAPPGVYSPHETSSTRFFMDHFPALGLEHGKGRRLLEVGCGAGAISLLAARNGWDVSAGDIDPVAVEATRANARVNGLQVDARVSDLFAAFEGEQFDTVLFNQPFFHVEREIGTHERTLSDFGGQLHVRFMEQVKTVLKPEGFVIVAFSNCSNTQLLQQPGWSLKLRAFDFDAASDYIRALFMAHRRKAI